MFTLQKEIVLLAMRILLFLSAFLFFCVTPLRAQRKGPEVRSVQNSAASKLSKSLEAGRSDAELAEDYLALARELVAAGTTEQVGDYFSRAIQHYLKAGERERAAAIYRELARVQESRGQPAAASASYTEAARLTRRKPVREMNENDAQRLANPADLKVQSEYIRENIDLLENMKAAEMEVNEEMAVSHTRMAQVRKDMNDKSGAVQELKTALETAGEMPAESRKIKQEIAEIYAETEPEKAVEINRELVEETKRDAAPRERIRQLQNLSSAYAGADRPEEAEASLQEAYELALSESHTLEAKRSLQLLVGQYDCEKNTRKALEAYADFVDRLDGLLLADSTLIDDHFFRVQEERITRLENERALKDELIARTARFNYVLLVSVFLTFAFLMFIARALWAIKRKNKRIALQSLRREMNPHFIFNSLNSVNQFIAQNNELEANKYLASYSRLMRTIMEHSNRDFIPLSAELEQMREYLELEQMRFTEKFTYRMEVDPTLDADAVMIPNMLIQPQLENAVWHGLRYREGGGELLLSVRADGERVCVRIEDDGIGLRKSRELKTEHQRRHRSRGLTNTRERILLLNDLYHVRITLEIEEKEAPESGVVVALCFPLHLKTAR